MKSDKEIIIMASSELTQEEINNASLETLLKIIKREYPATFRKVARKTK